MSKKILVFADGTGNEGGLLPDASCTNVYNLYRATRIGPDSPIDPQDQLALYVPGIGTPIPGEPPSFRRRASQTVEQMFGNGLTKRIVACYAAILGVWSPGDLIYLFGFSRGAYTVRCLAHVLEAIGIPTKDKGSAIRLDPAHLRKLAAEAVRIIYRWGLPVRDVQKRDAAAALFRRDHECQSGAESGAVPYFIGVWDTVAAVGWGHLFPVTYDEHFPKTVRFARHALAIDEYRKDFLRVPWGGSGTVSDGKPGEPDPFQQIWFAGNHADIGGSYPNNESRLSDITLGWMADFIEHELPAEARVRINRAVLKCSPSAAGMMHDECMVGIGGTVFRWDQTDRLVPAQAELHGTVYERLRMPQVRNFVGYGPYRPASLRNHEKAKQFYQGLPTGAAGMSPS